MDWLKDSSYDDFGEFLEAEGAHEDIIRTFLDNRISGEAFLSLEEDDLKELVPVIGDRIFVKKLLQQAQKTAIPIMVHSYCIGLVSPASSVSVMCHAVTLLVAATNIFVNT